MKVFSWLLNPACEIERLVKERVDERLEQHIGPAFQDLWDFVLKESNSLTRLGNRMAEFEDQIAVLDDVTNDIADRIEANEALIAELRAAVAAGDQGRAEALAAQSAAHAATLSAAVDKLRALGADAENPVPDPTPLPTPENP